MIGIIFIYFLAACGEKSSFEDFNEIVRNDESIDSKIYHDTDVYADKEDVVMEVLDNELTDEQLNDLISKKDDNQQSITFEADAIASEKNPDGPSENNPDSPSENKDEEQKEDNDDEKLNLSKDYNAIIWPPNHKMVLFKVTDFGMPSLDQCRVKTILSSEAGDSDFEIVSGDLFALRATRNAQNKQGRTYTVAFECDKKDQDGIERIERSFLVPHSMGMLKKSGTQKNNTKVKKIKKS